MDLKQYHLMSNLTLAISLAALFYFGNPALYNVVYFAIFVFCTIRTLQSDGLKRQKLLVIVAYLVCMAVQLVVCVIIVGDNADVGFGHPLLKLLAVLITLFPMLITRYVLVGKYAHLYLPSLQEAGAISFAELRENRDRFVSVLETAKTAKNNFTLHNFIDVITDFPRHDLFKYINEGSLTEQYFERARATLDDPYLYIIISDTGSPASELLTVFTQKPFNHASLAFDEDLETTVSYNGGERVYPPGLNYELVETLVRKPDASILVYRLPCTREQKALVLGRIDEINREGSAFNLLGLLTNQTYKPNILFCAQFVHKMLSDAGLAYFETETGRRIRPTDFIEKDYYRKLEFAYQLKLGKRETDCRIKGST
jgi:hypothetical protein